MMLELKKEIIYGPVNSRRLGRSLGLNLLPSGRKVCTFDCLYCQYGLNAAAECAADGNTSFPTVLEVERALGEALRASPSPPAYITFSGNGEPTLHPRFPEMVESVIRLRDALAPGARTAILSNSSTAMRPPVRAALARLDARIMKLDAGTQGTFARYSRPCAGLTLGDIVEALASLPSVTIQTLFTAGPRGNLGGEEAGAWAERIREIAPRLVQIYTLARPFPCPDLAPASREALLAVECHLAKLAIPAEVF